MEDATDVEELNEVVEVGTWRVVEEEVALGVDVTPQPASTTAPPVNAAPISKTLARHRPPPGAPTAYASTVSASSRSAKRRCASARRVGMCSDGTSWAEYPFSTRRATVWRCTSSGPS